jgi:hypothetical protein
MSKLKCQPNEKITKNKFQITNKFQKPISITKRSWIDHIRFDSLAGSILQIEPYVFTV